jgi:hypothetical protein
MGVLSPWLLALGLGMAVPLLLHLFQRHQGPRVIFPALRYLRRAEKESARRVKLRQWLLMLLRIAVVLLLALAAARPFLLGAGSAHEPAAVVIVLDNSLSTSAVIEDERVLDGLRARALETLGNAGPDDRFWLLRAASPSEPALSGDALATAQRVRETEATSASADLRGALARARAILAAGAGGRAAEIHVLSDLQATELRGLESVGAAPPLLLWSPRSDPPANRAVVDVALAGGMAPLAGTRTQLVAQVGGHGAEADSLSVRLFIGDRLAAAGSTRAGSAVVLSLPAREAGLLRGRVETDADALHADDQRFFVARVVPPPAVAAPGASLFLQDALEVMAQAGRVRLGAAAADVVLLSGTRPLPPIRSTGTLVIVPPASAVELPALNRQLAAAGIAWSYGPGAPGGSGRFASADSTDALQRSLQQVRLATTYALAPRAAQSADSILLRTQEGAAWAVRGELRGGGRFLLLGSPLDAEATSIPTSAAMIPLLDRIVGAWAAAAAERLEVAAGERVALPPTATRVLRPDGVTEPVSGAALTAPPLAGIYEVYAGESLLTAFAVNPPAAESDLRRARTAAAREVFGGWDVTLAETAAEWRRAIFQARLGLELWRPLLFALIALLVIEGAAAAAGARRRSATAAATEAA